MISTTELVEELYGNGSLKVKTKRERLLDPAYIDNINKVGEVLVRFRDDIIVPNGNLADVKNTLGLRYFSNNNN